MVTVTGFLDDSAGAAATGSTVNIGSTLNPVASGTITTTDVVVGAPAGTGLLLSGASTAGSYVAVKSNGGDGAWITEITGLTSGTIYFEGSPDSTTGGDGQWASLNGRLTGIVNTVLTAGATQNGMYRGNTAGLQWFRARAVGALTGTPAIRLILTSGTGAVFLNASIPAGGNLIGTVGGNTGGYSATPSAAFTRPANVTAYAIGQLVANNTVAASVTPLSVAVARSTGATGLIVRARLVKSGTSLTNASFRVHLYTVSPVCTNGDGAAWLTDNALNYVGALDVTMGRAFSDGANGTAVPVDGSQAVFKAVASNLFALIEARAAYTPVSAEVFTLTLETVQD